MSELLFEIGTEEIPAGYIDPALDFMAQAAAKLLKEARLSHGEISVEGTPRRLVLMIKDVADGQPDQEVELLGPNAKAAWQADGTLSQAALGFMRAKGIYPEDIFRKDTGKGEVLAAKIVERGKNSLEILPSVLSQLLTQISFPKTMRWDDSGVRFARPVRWILALFGSQTIPVSFGKVTSANITYGHRFLAPDPVAIDGLDSYLAILSQRFVMLSRARRRELILEEGHKLAESIGGQVRPDDGLLDIVKNLVERPWPIMGQFDAKYLEVPHEILICEMREHQKYFSVQNKTGQLLPAFLVIAGTKPEDAKQLAAGNARVLRARFEDGAFYFQEDLKKPLPDFALQLDKLLFQRELGSMRQKVERIKSLAEWLATQLSLSSIAQSHLLAAAELCKADLLSGVVGQFPELQGRMGAIYAGKAQYAPEVCEAIEQHYWPRFATDETPRGDIGAALALADKLDTLVGVIAIGKIPKGSADPFALRRVSAAICRILLAKDYRLSLEACLKKAISLLDVKLVKNSDQLLNECLQFVQARLPAVLSGDGVVIEAAMGAGFFDVVDLKARLEALLELQQNNQEVFSQLAATLKRAGNIVAKAKADGLMATGQRADFSVLTHVAEKELLASVKSIESTKISSYTKYLGQIAAVKPTLDQFFVQVMVMVDDSSLRLARLRLLERIETLALKVADFKKLV